MDTWAKIGGEQSKGEDPTGEHQARPGKSECGGSRGRAPRSTEEMRGPEGPGSAGPCPPGEGLCTEQGGEVAGSVGRVSASPTHLTGSLWAQIIVQAGAGAEWGDQGGLWCDDSPPRDDSQRPRGGKQVGHVVRS